MSRREASQEGKTLGQEPRALSRASKAFYEKVWDLHPDEGRSGPTLEAYLRWVGAALSRGSRVLEIGCGTGRNAHRLALSGAEVVATDLARGFRAQALPPASGHVWFALADVCALPFPDGCFDVVCSLDVLEHVPNPGRALGEMIRVLAPGGQVFVSGPNLYSCGQAFALMLQAMVRGHTRPLWGGTRLGAVSRLLGCIGAAVRKRFCRNVRFDMRQPVFDAQSFVYDEDACYLLHPTDLERFFRNAGLEILPARLALSRVRSLLRWLSPCLVGPVSLCARKPASRTDPAHAGALLPLGG